MLPPAGCGVTSVSVPASRATAKPLTPPGRSATGRASPPAAGSIHSAARSSPAAPFASSAAAGSARREVNSRSPAGVNDADDSPAADRVSRRAARSPLGSISHSDVP